MDQNQNPTPIVSEVSSPTPPGTTTPVIRPGESQNPIKPASKFSIKAIISTIIFLLLAGGAAAGFVYREPILQLVSKPTPSPTPTPTTAPSPTPDISDDWKAYSGDGFTFSYPSTEFTNHDNEWLSSNNSAQPWIQIIANVISSDYEIISICKQEGENITVAGNPTCKIYFEKGHTKDSIKYNSENPNTVTFLIENNDEFIQLEFMTQSREDLTTYEPYIEKMIASFQIVATVQQCMVSGCSGQICQDASDEPMASTCEYREQYACYKKTKCEVQSDGECGWTQNAEFTTCLEETK